MNQARRKALNKINDVIQTQIAALEEIIQEEQDYFDNMPESFQGAEKGSRVEEIISSLEDAKTSLEEVPEYLEQAINP